MKSRVVAVKTAPNKISIEFQNGTVWEYEKGELSYTEWTLGKPTDWFIPDTLEFLKKINRYIEEAVAHKKKSPFLKATEEIITDKMEKMYNDLIDSSINKLSEILKDHQVDAAKYGVSYTMQTLQNKKLPPRPSKHRLVVWKDYESFDKTVDDIMGNYRFTDLRYANIHMIHCDAPQHEIEKFRGYTFDHVLFINCNEAFLPPELTTTMHYAKLTYCR